MAYGSHNQFLKCAQNHFKWSLYFLKIIFFREAYVIRK